MSTASARPAAGQRLVLDNVDWPTYSRLLRIFAEQRGMRMAYDRGKLEIMSPLPEREVDVTFLGRLVVALTEELGLPIKEGGSMTLRRRRKRRGIEPDRCYWIANESKMRGKRTFSPRVDPPPDLAIEVDVTSSSLDRLGIYSALGVPEVWRFEEPTLAFLCLGPNRSYSAVPNSLSFPFLKPADLMSFLPLRAQLDENGIVRQFRAWLQQNMSSGGAASNP